MTLRFLTPFLGLTLLWTGCDKSAAAAEETAAEETTAAAETADPTDTVARRVAFAPAESATRAAILTLPAEVVLPPGARFAVGPPIEGRIVKWNVALGDTVTAGDALADMLSPGLADLLSRTKELDRVVKARARVLRQRRRDVKAGFRTADVAQDARLQLEEAKAQLARLQQEMSIRQSLVATGGDGATGEWQWRAGTSGVVEGITCSAGSVQSSAASCVKLLDPSRAELRVAVPERRLAQLGTSTRADWRAASAPERPIPMLLSRRAPVVDRRSRTRDVYWMPERPADTALMIAGATGVATLTVAAPSGVVRVPRFAVTDLEGKTVVFTQSAEDIGKAVPVDVLGRIETDMLVRGDGLSVGTPVAVRGVFLLKSHLLLGGE